MFSTIKKVFHTFGKNQYYASQTNIFSINLQKFNFARKTNNKDKDLGSENSKNTPSSNQEEPSVSKTTKTINIIREDIPIKISPYFSKAVSEKEKSANSINISQLVDSKERSSGDGDLSKEQKEIVIKAKQKLTAAKKQASKSIGVIVENIKRDFRMGLTSDDMKDHHPLVQRALSLDNASIEEFKKARMLEIRKTFGRHERDTATPPITACALCEKVLAVLSHIKKNKNDMSAFMKLQKYLTKRRKYLLYLKRTDFNSYSYVIKYYGLKDFEDPQHKNFKAMPSYGKMPPQKDRRVQLPLRMNKN